MPGVPRATYMPYPFQIVQTPDNILMAYEFAGASRIVRMGQPGEAPADSWMGWSRGRWDGDTLHFTVEAMGQRVGARLTVFDAHVHAAFDLPPFLALFADKIRAKLQKDGPKLLE